jgi:hypothetical protein
VCSQPHRAEAGRHREVGDDIAPQNPARLDAPAILKRLASSGRVLAELKIGRRKYNINLASNAVLQPQPA